MTPALGGIRKLFSVQISIENTDTQARGFEFDPPKTDDLTLCSELHVVVCVSDETLWHPGLSV